MAAYAQFGYGYPSASQVCTNRKLLNLSFFYVLWIHISFQSLRIYRPTRYSTSNTRHTQTDKWKEKNDKWYRNAPIFVVLLRKRSLFPVCGTQTHTPTFVQFQFYYYLRYLTYENNNNNNNIAGTFNRRHSRWFTIHHHSMCKHLSIGLSNRSDSFEKATNEFQLNNSKLWLTGIDGTYSYTKKRESVRPNSVERKMWDRQKKKCGRRNKSASIAY